MKYKYILFKDFTVFCLIQYMLDMMEKKTVVLSQLLVKASENNNWNS